MNSVCGCTLSEATPQETLPSKRKYPKNNSAIILCVFNSLKFLYPLEKKKKKVWPTYVISCIVTELHLLKKAWTSSTPENQEISRPIKKTGS
jgi:hypothetical protein